MVKKCSCGQKVTFDPIKESWPLSKCRSTSFESGVDATNVAADATNYRTWSHQESRVKKLQKLWNQDLTYSENSGWSENWSQNRNEFKSSDRSDNLYFAHPVVLDPDLAEEEPLPPRPPPPKHYDVSDDLGFGFLSLPRKITSTAKAGTGNAIRKSASTDLVTRRTPDVVNVGFSTPFDRFVTSASDARVVDFQKVAG